jgi:hypothetical protein
MTTTFDPIDLLNRFRLTPFASSPAIRTAAPVLTTPIAQADAVDVFESTDPSAVPNAFAPAGTDSVDGAAPDGTAPPASQPPPDAPAQDGPDSSDETATRTPGVVRLLQEGHFKGVAAVRLRLNFYEQLDHDALPPLSPAHGNGKVYAKFLQEYDARCAASGDRGAAPVPAEGAGDAGAVDTVA